MTKKLYSILASLAITCSAHATICNISNIWVKITPAGGIPSGDSFAYSIPGTSLGSWIWTNWTCTDTMFMKLLTSNGLIDQNHTVGVNASYQLNAIYFGTNLTTSGFPGLGTEGTFDLSSTSTTNFSRPTVYILVEWDYLVNPDGTLTWLPLLDAWELENTGGSPCCKAVQESGFDVAARFASDLGHSSFPALWEGKYPVAMGLDMEPDGATIKAIHYGHILPNGELYPVVDAVNDGGKFRLLNASHLTNREVDGK